MNLVIFGASARAAAMSALRAGLQPWCADLFADRDLRQLCPARRVPGRDYPHGFVDLAAEAPAGPWIYTGGLENHPDIVDRIAQRRPLWGNPGSVLRRVRSPFEVAKCLAKAGLPCPRVAANAREATPEKSWLLKPRYGTGGRGIALWHRNEAVKGNCYLQEFVEGLPISAIFTAHDASEASLYGVTQQLVGESWLNARPFHYCGSIGPLPLAPACVQVLTSIGKAAATYFGLRGVFAIDCIVRDSVPWPVEINPRYAASVEVLERRHITPLLTLAHADSQAKLPHPAGPAFVGKAILFAKMRVVFPPDGPWMDSLSIARKTRPSFADIPDPEQAIDEGKPVLTLFATGDTMAECNASLVRTVQELRQVLFEAA